MTKEKSTLGSGVMQTYPSPGQFYDYRRYGAFQSRLLHQPLSVILLPLLSMWISDLSYRIQFWRMAYIGNISAYT